jgi:hypothetical protein
MYTDHKARALEYFFHFSTKNLELISDMFADDVHLQDWEHSTNNKEETVAVYKKMFDSVDTITVTPFALYEDSSPDGLTVIAELWITVDGKDQFFVTDIIVFDDDTDLIRCVRAYRKF